MKTFSRLLTLDAAEISSEMTIGTAQGSLMHKKGNADDDRRNSERILQMSGVRGMMKPPMMSRRTEFSMSKQLAFLRKGAVEDPIETIIGDLLTVHSINGHLPDRGEVVDELLAWGRSSCVEDDVKRVLAWFRARIRVGARRESNLRPSSVEHEGGALPDIAVQTREVPGKSPYDLCLAYSSGELQERALVSELNGFAYTEPAVGHLAADGAWPNSWQEVEDAYADKLIGRTIFAIVAASRSTRLEAGSGG